MTYLPWQWQTERLVIQDATLTEVDELRTVFNTCHHIEKWDPTFILVPLAEMTELIAKSVNAPADSETQFRLQAARIRGDERIIGYFHTYQKQPTPNLPWPSCYNQARMAALHHQKRRPPARLSLVAKCTSMI